MITNIEELLKLYEIELNLDEKIQHDDYEGIGQTFVFRGALLSELDSLTEEQYKKILKFEKIIEKYKDSLIANYPQLKTTINDGRLKLFDYFLQKVA